MPCSATTWTLLHGIESTKVRARAHFVGHCGRICKGRPLEKLPQGTLINFLFTFIPPLFPSSIRLVESNICMSSLKLRVDFKCNKINEKRDSKNSFLEYWVFEKKKSFYYDTNECRKTGQMSRWITARQLYCRRTACSAFDWHWQQRAKRSPRILTDETLLHRSEDLWKQ